MWLRVANITLSDAGLPWLALLAFAVALASAPRGGRVIRLRLVAARKSFNLIRAPLRAARDDAAERTKEAISQEHGETEAGYTMSNGQRRAEVQPVPPDDRVDIAVARQYDDLVLLVADEVLSRDELREKMDRMPGGSRPNMSED